MNRLICMIFLGRESVQPSSQVTSGHFQEEQIPIYFKSDTKRNFRHEVWVKKRRLHSHEHLWYLVRSTVPKGYARSFGEYWGESSNGF